MRYRESPADGLSPGFQFVDSEKMTAWAQASIILSNYDEGLWNLEVLKTPGAPPRIRVSVGGITFLDPWRTVTAPTFLEAIEQARGLDFVKGGMGDSEVPDDMVAWFRRDQEICKAIDSGELTFFRLGKDWLVEGPEGPAAGCFRVAVTEAMGWDWVPFPRYRIRSLEEIQPEEPCHEEKPQRHWLRRFFMRIFGRGEDNHER